MTLSPPLLSDIGEKALIRSFIKPLFNPDDEPDGVGDDCAMVPFGKEVALLSTDRVPSDLTAFQLGILDHRGLGDYLARLNLSDIAACGGEAVGLLLNLGLPGDMLDEDARALCHGFADAARRHGAVVLGGDITSATELSISATSIGKSTCGRVLSRRHARPGDRIFVSRPIGLTPAALSVLPTPHALRLTEEERALLQCQFTVMEPMLTLGRHLSASGLCGACMDNTDGIGQTLTELADASRVAFIVEKELLHIPTLVTRVAHLLDVSAVELIFDGGADFSLIGTLREGWQSEQAAAFGSDFRVIGRVEAGEGVSLEQGNARFPLSFRAWNYFSTLHGARR